jgi:hypothetical protein
MLKHYVDFLSPGSFFPESEGREVKDRIPCNLKKIPSGIYALSYFDREEVVVKNETLEGRAKGKSCRVIFGKKVHWKKIEDTPNNGILRRNIENNGYKGYGIKCVTGNWQPFLKGDIVLKGYDELKTLVESI